VFADGFLEEEMTSAAFVLSTVLVCAGAASAGPASGTVKSQTGTIAPQHAIAYVVRNSRNARETRVELLLTDVPVDAARLAGELDPHVVAINFEELRDRDYLLLWIGADGAPSMNATYSKTMTQYLNDASGGLKAELTTNTPARIAGRIYSAAPLKTMDGPTYTIDVTFAAEVVAAPTGTPLPAGGGDPGKALATFLASPQVSVMLPDRETAEVYAGVFNQLRRDRHPIPTNDISAAATTLHLFVPLISRGMHFRLVDGLRASADISTLLRVAGCKKESR